MKTTNQKNMECVAATADTRRTPHSQFAIEPELTRDQAQTKNNTDQKKKRSSWFLGVTFAILTSNSVFAHDEDHMFGKKDIVGLPPHGQVGIGIGQTTDQLYYYKKDVLKADHSAPYPYTINLYTDLIRFDSHVTESGFLGGLAAPNFDENGALLLGFKPWRNDTVVDRCKGGYIFNEERNNGLNDLMNFQVTLSEYPKALIVIGLKLGECNSNNAEPIKALSALYTGQNPFNLSPDILAQYKRAVNVFVNYTKNLNREVLVRPMYEIDASFKCYAVNNDPSYAINSFRYLKQQFVLAKAENVGLIWHVGGADIDTTSTNPVLNPLLPGHYDLWYPGDKFVDWIGLSYWVANAEYQLKAPSADRAVRNIIYDFARKHKRPVTYSELSAVSLYFPQDNVHGCIWFDGTPFATTSKEIWEKYFTVLFKEIEDNKDVVRLLGNYINNNWGTSVCWGDNRLQVNNFIRQHFFEKISKRPYFQTDRPKLDKNSEIPFSYPCPQPQ